MFLNKKSSVYNFIIYISIALTLVATPNSNKDALIIPKVSILFCSASIVFPYLFYKLKVNKEQRIINMLIILTVLFFIQLALVMVLSESPLEQQMFGRSGRGLGFITLFSVFTISLGCAFFIRKSDERMLVKGLTISGALTALYALFQSIGLDFAPWDSKTNGVISTLGNPNFVSSFAAMSILPSLIFISTKKFKILYRIAIAFLFMLTIYKAGSTQGYINLAIALTIFVLIYLWYFRKAYFYIVFLLFLSGSYVAISSFFNRGPLSSILYKVSVQSRGEFWQAALNTSNAHPIFGVGLDSFGDYSLMYRKQAVINEYTDSAHNYILDFSANGGYTLALLYVLISLLTLICFFKLQIRSGKFDPTLTALFSAYVVFQAQSLISPICIPLLVWGVVISGSIIGLTVTEVKTEKLFFSANRYRLNASSFLMFLLSLVILFPFFNSDRLQLIAMNTRNADLAIQVAKMYPESVVRYSTLTRELLNSGLTAPALDLARSAVDFNPNSPALWVLILINPAASIEERKAAKAVLLNQDPLNQEVINYEIK